MKKKNMHYCFTLSDEQMKYLRNKKYKIDRMECFMSLVVLAERETKLVTINKTQQVEILPGQVMIDNTKLAKLWDKDRKTIPKLLESMEALGISSSQKIGENKIHTLHCLSGWYVDGWFHGNAFALKRNADRTAIVHAEVPPAKIIITEVSNDKNNSKDNSALRNDKSTNENKVMISVTDGNLSKVSPISNDNNNVDKFETDEKNSDSFRKKVPHSSDTIPY